MNCQSNDTRPLPAATSATHFWRSLEELAGHPEFETRLRDEFPRHADVWNAATDRRQFFQLMAASFALAGMHGCSSPPPEPILPYVRSPAGMTTGMPLQFATALPRSDGALGLVVASHMGRPVKVEGNPLHPASLGATDASAQASVLTLYDPDRSQAVRRAGEIATWSEFITLLRGDLESLGADARLHVVSPPVNSPTLIRQRQMLIERFPRTRWYEYEPSRQAGSVAASRSAFGRAMAPVYNLAEAGVVVSLDANFMHQGSASIRYARDFMQRRSSAASNRLYAIESTFSPTGAAADHRLPLSPGRIAQFTRALAAKFDVASAGSADPGDEKWLAAVVDDLNAQRGGSLVIVGEHLPAELHALTSGINQALGNIGSTVHFIDPIAPGMADSPPLDDLAAALDAGEVDWLLILDANPAYDAPGALQFAAALPKARRSVHFGLYDDETAELCHWHIPAAHYLESWSDARAFDGTASIVQPLIAPLYGGRTVHELLSAMLEPAARPSYEIVRDTWQEVFAGDFDARWHAALSDGVIDDTQFERQAPTFDATQAASSVAAANESSVPSDQFELVLAPDPSVGDGRAANNGWLQELPKPITKLTWENAVLLSPATAKKLSLNDGDEVRLSSGDLAVAGPVCIVPGHADGCVTCHFGYGRTRGGRTANGRGFSAYALLPGGGEPTPRSVTVTKTGGRVQLARTQHHHLIDGRNIVHTATLEQLQSDPDAVLPEADHDELPSLYPEKRYEGFAWGMAIDLSKCMGCNACVVACQAENNVPIVGKEQVLRGREMHWLRIDSYFAGAAENPEAVQQPMLCQHCEKAPCEVVCPVAATTHSKEGLNEMTYNRCIGTRYCSNNCPYKVRRFNFFEYSSSEPAVLQLLRNPEVTVRSRGVMEKCTYCVQRIDRARIAAKKEAVATGKPTTIADGSLQTACQQACPAQAIVFGDINDSNSQVSKLKADPRNYGVLSELGTTPRTTYLVRIRNPHPDLG